MDEIFCGVRIRFMVPHHLLRQIQFAFQFFQLSVLLRQLHSLLHILGTEEATVMQALSING